MIVYINVYAMTRHFGGPEEGGWYYNAGSPLASVPYIIDDENKDGEAVFRAINSKFFTAEIERYREMFKEHKHGDIYSVNGGVDVNVCMDEESAAPFPLETPRYE